MACDRRRLAPVATSSPWAVADEVKQGDEWMPYVVARTYYRDETRDRFPSAREMATEDW
jgi:hypothetical protein